MELYLSALALGLAAVVAVVLNRRDLAEKQLQIGRILLGVLLVFVVIMALITVFGAAAPSAL
jgi:hypothetical protein